MVLLEKQVHLQKVGAAVMRRKIGVSKVGSMGDGKKSMGGEGKARQEGNVQALTRERRERRNMVNMCIRAIAVG